MWNDPALAKRESRRQFAESGDLRRPSLGWFGNHLHLRKLPLQSQPRMESQGRRGNVGRVADRSRRQGQRGRVVYVQRIDGAIGYVEYAYAEAEQAVGGENDEPGRRCRCAERNHVCAAAAGADWTAAPGMYLVLTDQPGKSSWPMTGASFILMHTSQDQRGNCQRSARSSSTGRSRMATRWRSSWTTCRCRTRSST